MFLSKEVGLQSVQLLFLLLSRILGFLLEVKKPYMKTNPRHSIRPPDIC